MFRSSASMPSESSATGAASSALATRAGFGRSIEENRNIIITAFLEARKQIEIQLGEASNPNIVNQIAFTILYGKLKGLAETEIVGYVVSELNNTTIAKVKGLSFNVLAQNLIADFTDHFKYFFGAAGVRDAFYKAGFGKAVSGNFALNREGGLFLESLRNEFYPSMRSLITEVSKIEEKEILSIECQIRLAINRSSAEEKLIQIGRLEQDLAEFGRSQRLAAAPASSAGDEDALVYTGAVEMRASFEAGVDRIKRVLIAGKALDKLEGKVSLEALAAECYVLKVRYGKDLDSANRELSEWLMERGIESRDLSAITSPVVKGKGDDADETGRNLIEEFAYGFRAPLEAGKPGLRSKTPVDKVGAALGFDAETDKSFKISMTALAEVGGRSNVSASGAGMSSSVLMKRRQEEVLVERLGALRKESEALQEEGTAFGNALEEARQAYYRAVEREYLLLQEEIFNKSRPLRVNRLHQKYMSKLLGESGDVDGLESGVKVKLISQGLIIADKARIEEAAGSQEALEQQQALLLSKVPEDIRSYLLQQGQEIDERMNAKLKREQADLFEKISEQVLEEIVAKTTAQLEEAKAHGAVAAGSGATLESGVASSLLPRRSPVIARKPDAALASVPVSSSSASHTPAVTVASSAPAPARAASMQQVAGSVASAAVLSPAPRPPAAASAAATTSTGPNSDIAPDNWQEKAKQFFGGLLEKGAEGSRICRAMDQYMVEFLNLQRGAEGEVCGKNEEGLVVPKVKMFGTGDNIDRFRAIRREGNIGGTDLEKGYRILREFYHEFLRERVGAAEDISAYMVDEAYAASVRKIQPTPAVVAVAAAVPAPAPVSSPLGSHTSAVTVTSSAPAPASAALMQQVGGLVVSAVPPAFSPSLQIIAAVAAPVPSPASVPVSLPLGSSSPAATVASSASQQSGGTPAVMALPKMTGVPIFPGSLQVDGLAPSSRPRSSSPQAGMSASAVAAETQQATGGAPLP